MRPSALITPARHSPRSDGATACLDGGDVFTEASTLRRPREWTYVRKDGERITVSLVVTAMSTDAGDLLGYLGVAHDVTQQKQYEAWLREAMQKAELASLAKSQFLANMSHEIRTPMNAVIGLSYLLGQTTLDRQQADFLGKIKLASKALLEVINDVLDLSKIEAGELGVELAPFNLRALLLQQREVMTVQADARGIGFDLDVGAGVPVELVGDATRLNQVLRNLLSNAIKFTDAGGVALRVRSVAPDASNDAGHSDPHDEPTGAAHVRLRFEVQDSGIGITPEVQQRLFMPFAQADASTTRRFGGTGLGLSIVKRLALLMRGEVGVQSTPGVGSVFHVELPFALAPREAAALRGAASKRHVRQALLGVRVLVVDDNEINLDVARHILSGAGARVDVARNGQEAFELIAARPQAFDVVLMDVQMPVLDGHQATRRIRDELGLAGLPIIALTAGALTSERQYALEAGMNDFVSKPFEVRSLVACILRHLTSAGTPACDAAEAVQSLDAAAEILTAQAASWPEIDGIDATDVRERLGGDTALFASMLERLIGESADIQAWLQTAGHVAAAEDADRAVAAAALPAHAARMHKLRGSAGTLGARLIHQLAGEAEQASRDGDLRLAADVTARLLSHLNDLAERSAPARAALARAPAPGITTDADTADDPQARQGLVDLLRRQSMSALDRFDGLSPQLRRDLGDVRYAEVRTHLDHLRFAEAATLLGQTPA